MHLVFWMTWWIDTYRSKDTLTRWIVGARGFSGKTRVTARSNVSHFLSVGIQACVEHLTWSGATALCGLSMTIPVCFGEGAWLDWPKSQWSLEFGPQEAFRSIAERGPPVERTVLLACSPFFGPLEMGGLSENLNTTTSTNVTVL